MIRALGPRVGMGSELAMPLTVLGLCWAPVAACGAIWLAGGAASALTGHGWSTPNFDLAFARTVLTAGVAPLWPGVSAVLIWSLTTVLGFLVLAPAAIYAVRRLRAAPSGDPVGSLAGPADLKALTPDGVTDRARRLRSSLEAVPARQLRPADTGLALGRLRTRRGRGPVLRASWEDVVLAVMAPRAGKTTSLAVPAILDAPGAVIATSNKSDLWAATATVRAAETQAPVWVFDPQSITGEPRSWWWNPLDGVTTIEEAHRLAGHFIQEVRGDRGERDFWTSAAHDLLAGLLLAAGLSGRQLDEVYEWLNDPVLPTPVQLLREHGQHAAAASMLGRQHGAPETRDGVYETARTAAQCLRDDAIMAWVTQSSSSRLPAFDATTFPLGRDTLYLLSKDGAGAAAPLVAALADRVMRAAVRAAERAGGRLDPPMVVVLDEAANVCRIADLPELYSHLGSRGVLPVTILQSYRQGTRVWGENGMDALWSAATCKVIGAGLDDARVAEDVSRLIGDHDVPVRSINRGDGRASESISLRRQRILPPEDLRALPRGQALLLATGCRAALMRLLPWYQSERAGQISDALKTQQKSKASLERR